MLPFVQSDHIKAYFVFNLIILVYTCLIVFFKCISALKGAIACFLWTLMRPLCRLCKVQMMF